MILSTQVVGGIQPSLWIRFSRDVDSKKSWMKSGQVCVLDLAEYGSDLVDSVDEIYTS
jgi:hypothetical protein